jgi:predicted metal-dependent phosphotriesterase family hydrolase
MDNQQELPIEVDVTINQLGDQIEKDLDAISEKYGVNILVAIGFKNMDNAGIFYKGDDNMLIQYGLAKIIENKFKE